MGFTRIDRMSIAKNHSSWLGVGIYRSWWNWMWMWTQKFAVWQVTENRLTELCCYPSSFLWWVHNALEFSSARNLIGWLALFGAIEEEPKMHNPKTLDTRQARHPMRYDVMDLIFVAVHGLLELKCHPRSNDGAKAVKNRYRPKQCFGGKGMMNEHGQYYIYQSMKATKEYNLSWSNTNHHSPHPPIDIMTHQVLAQQPILIEDDASSWNATARNSSSMSSSCACPESKSSPPQIPHFFKFPCNPRELKIQKRKFMVFIRVLVGYLGQKDPALCQRVHTVVRDCSRRNRRREPGYESCVISIHRRLRETVSYHHWTRAENYLRYFVHRHRAAARLVVPDWETY